MFWPATLMGALAGALLASIPGALLGGLLGQMLDRRLALHSWDDVRQLLGWPVPVADQQLVFLLLGRLAKSDGPVRPAHIQCAREQMQRLKLDAPGCGAAIAAFNQGKVGGVALRGALRRLRAQPRAAESVLRACWRMAWADGQVGRAERELIMLWGRWMGWSSAAVEQLGTAPQDSARSASPIAARSAYEQALALLGLDSGSDAVALKRAYRRLLSRHHPDKLAGAGASAERIREATEKTAQLHAAYRLIRARHPQD